MSNILSLQNVHAFYGQTQALFGLHLTVRKGGITALLGANGAGKTTTLRAITSMVRTTGSITLDGINIANLKTEDIARVGVAHVPDDRGTFSELSVDENLRLGGYLQRSASAYKKDLENIFDYFPVLQRRINQQAGTLSGGEQQMLAISRALMLRPKLMVLDEPSFGLAPLVVKEIFSILRLINKEQHASILLVEQNASLALELADNVFLIESGRNVLSGSAEEMKDNDDVRRAYLGY